MRQDAETEAPQEARETAAGEAAASNERARVLSPAAERALAEAAERRKAQEEREAALAAAREIDGRGAGIRSATATGRSKGSRAISNFFLLVCSLLSFHKIYFFFLAW